LELSVKISIGSIQYEVYSKPCNAYSLTCSMAPFMFAIHFQHGLNPYLHQH
jgi:hypothetical protein